jgi:hypothetical protein
VGTFESPDAWIAEASPYVLGPYHVWMMVNGMRDRPALRGGNDDMTSSRALSMDLDHQAPEGAHADLNLPTREEVLKALASLGEVAPNLVVNTGWGLQPYWRLSHEVTIEQRQSQLYALADWLAERGLKIERLDAAGMFRVPGSSNIKIDPIRPVVIEQWVDGPGFLLEYLDKRCPAVAVPSLGKASRPAPGPVNDAQRAVLACVIADHGASLDFFTRDRIFVRRPGRTYGHQASIWKGKLGDAVLTVWSPDWPTLGPVPPATDASWVLGTDGKLYRSNDDLQGVTMNGSNPPPPPSDQKRLLVWEHAPDPFIIRPIEWVVEGLWCQETHGELAGGEKTLKSYIGLIIDVGIAAGMAVFGRFAVERPGRVLHLCGEGGRSGYWRRFGRVCDAYGVVVGDVRPNHRVTFNTSSMNNPAFLDEVADALEDFGPGFAHLDPYYAYAPSRVDSARLVEVGAALESLGSLCARHEASLLMNNHFNETGTGNGLTRITGAGHAEWCDSWLLVRHREKADVERGRFKLRLDIGSRQWGGTSWDLDLDIGAFNPLTRQHDGVVAWTINPASDDDGRDPQDAHDEKIITARLALLKVGRKQRRLGKPFTKTELVHATAGNHQILGVAFDQLVGDGSLIDGPPRAVPFGRTTKQVPTYTVLQGR